jgi:hypothetical protein
VTQTTLLALAEPQTALCANSCQDCVNRQEPITSIGGKLKVHCFGKLKDARENCPSYSDGKELEYMKQFKPPAGFVPKKWAGGRA